MRKILFVNALILLVLFSILDAAMFFFLPPSYGWRFPEYRVKLPPDVGGNSRYPKGYFVQHDQRGFDIGKNQTGDHWVDGVSYPIWSNSLGCFDIDHSDIDQYVYFAGDSFTWGYTPFEQNFGTVTEQRIDTPIFKCGVTNTGQQHQIEKLKEIASEIQNPPGAIFVFYYSNDVANDYAHPHSTVVDGWQADNVSLDSNKQLIRHSQQEMVTKVQEKLVEIEEQKKVRKLSKNKFKANLKYYSLSINILVHLLDSFAAMMKPDELGSDGKKLEQAQRNFYNLSVEKDGVHWYLDNPKAKNNKAALLEFANYANTVNAELIVILIPPKTRATDANWYTEVRQFLTNNSIKNLDLASKFEEKGLTASDIYWPIDGHLNAEGNKNVANILIEEYSTFLDMR
ncbi:hypothetical protein N9850_12200 [Granulosicoccus sp.]|nr:hypothetical protein [Granulosicoccus sp.]MDB4224528.1 hypothetical protein [Granulosicoccus sp.]